MKIIGGTFGPTGAVKIEGGTLHISGAESAARQAQQVVSITSSDKSEIYFGFLGFFLGALILMAVGWYFFHLLGALFGLALAAAGSFSKKKVTTAEIVFDDGGRVTVQGSARQINALYTFKSSGL